MIPTKVPHKNVGLILCSFKLLMLITCSELLVWNLIFIDRNMLNNIDVSTKRIGFLGGTQHIEYTLIEYRI